MLLSLLTLMLRRSLVSSGDLAPNWWRLCEIVSVLPLMSLLVMLYLKKTTMLFMRLQRIAREPTRRVPHSPKLQSHLRLHSVLRHQLLSSAHRRRRIQAGLDFTRPLPLLFPRALPVKAVPVCHQATCRARIATSQATGQGSVLTLRRTTTKVAVRGSEPH